MHITAKSNADKFFKIYGSPGCSIVEIGSQDVNGSLRDLAPLQSTYIGVDFVAGKGVDLILNDPYSLPLPSDSQDIVISSSCFEHSEMFWLVFEEILRILKPHGLFYLNVPSNGNFHRYPVDCWRFYPDAAKALVSWGERQGYAPAVLESYTSEQYGDIWNDYVAVFIKDENKILNYPRRIITDDQSLSFTNGQLHGNNQILNYSEVPQDRR